MPPRTALGLASLAIAVAVIGWRRRRWVAGLAVGVMLGALTAAWHEQQLRHGLVPTLAKRHASVEVVARLVRDPLAVTTRYGTRLTIADATVTAIRTDAWYPVAAPVLVLSYSSGWVGLLPGQRLDLGGRLAPPRPADSVAAVLDTRGQPTLIGRPPWWQRAAGAVRAGLRNASDRLPSDERGLLPGLVVGDTSRMPPDLLTDMRTSGLSHLEAVSGENVSVVLAVTMAVAATFGLRRRARVVLGAVMLSGFVVLARPSASVLRAAVMGGVILLGVATGRRARTLPALSAAVLFLVIVNPFLARTVGFVLSVLATAALTTWAPNWAARLSTHMPRPVAVAIAVPAAAQLACTPILLLAFGLLMPYAVPANMLAAPAVAPATVLGLVAAGAGVIAPPLATAVAWVAVAPTAVIAQVARIAAALPGAALHWPFGAVGSIVVAVGVWLVLVARWHRRRREILARWPP